MISDNLDNLDNLDNMDNIKKTSEKIIVHGYDWTIEDLPETDHIQIKGWCLDRNSIPHMIRVEDFPEFCYVQLPQYIRGVYFKWDNAHVDLIYKQISMKLEKWGNSAPIRYEFVQKHTLYYYSMTKYPMLLLYFRRSSDLSKLQNILEPDGLFLPTFLYYKNIKLYMKVWETNIDMIRKYFTNRNTGMSQWFTADAERMNGADKMSTLEFEYKIDWRTMVSIPNSESKGWITYPSIFSYDIETYSDNPNVFTNKLHAKHCIFMVSCIYQSCKNGIKVYSKHCIVYGECEPIEDTEIINVKDEMSLIDEFCKLLIRLDPEILTGYNIFSFDNGYFQARMDLDLREWPNMSRLKEVLKRDVKRDVVIDRYATKMVSKSWRSNAYGTNTIHILHMEGRIHVDMLPVIKRSKKMMNYKLNDVAKEFLKKSKHDVTPAEMFKTFEKYKKSVTNPTDIALREDSMKEMTRVVKYCIQDSELVIELFENRKVWTDLIEMSNVVGVTPMQLFTRGQQIRCLSLVYHYACRRGFVIDRREQIIGDDFEGGFVYDPLTGLHDGVLCFDFAGLYPSIMRTYNICYTTFLKLELLHTIPDSQCNVFEFDQEIKKQKKNDNENALGDAEDKEDKEENEEKEEIVKKIIKRKYKFIKPEFRRGIIPEIEDSLVSARAEAKDQLKIEKDPAIRSILSIRELALKMTANSLFGFLGVKEGGKLSFLEGAMCITARGREMINKVYNYLKDVYNAKVIYGDTDSSMVDVGCKSLEECMIMGEKLAKEITNLFPPPIKIEFEKAMRILCLKKKHYAAALVKKGKDGMYYYDLNAENLMFKGILVARRDNFHLVRVVYTNLLLIGMKRESIVKAFDCIVDACELLLSGKVDIKELSVIRELGSYYTQENYFMNLFSKQLKKIGKPAVPGERLEYVIVENKNEKLLGLRMRTLDQYYEKREKNEEEKLDYPYYLERGFMVPIDNLFNCLYKDILVKMGSIGYTPPRGNFVSVASPVAMIIKMIKYGEKIDIREIKKWFLTHLEKKKESETFIICKFEPTYIKSAIQVPITTSPSQKQQSIMKYIL